MNRAVVAVLLALGACAHEQPFLPGQYGPDGPYSSGASWPLTFSTTDDRMPAWTPGESSFWYEFTRTDRTDRDHCLGLLPYPGGSRLNQLCYTSPTADDSTDVFESPSVAADGRVAFLHVQGRRGGNPNRGELLVAHGGTVQRVVRVPPPTAGGPSYDRAGYIQWLGPDSLAWVAQIWVPLRIFPSPVPDTLLIGLGVDVLRLGDSIPTRRSMVATATRHLVLMSGLAGAFVATVFAIYRPALLTWEDYRVSDLLARHGRADATGRIVIVDVDERSLTEIGQWPWRRDLIGQLVDRIREQGAASVALDVLMPEPDRFDRAADWHKSQGERPSPAPLADSDAALVKAVGQGRVVLGYAMTFGSEDDESRACVSHPLTIAVALQAGERNESPLFQATGAICNLPQLQQAAQAAGFLNAVPDADGILRRVPLVIEYDGLAYPGFGLAAVMTATGARVTALRVRNEAGGSLIVDDRPVPVDARGNLLLRYRGKKTPFSHVSAADVLGGRVPHDRFREKLVFVGATALGAQDVVTTPLDTLVAGIEVQATVADNLLKRDFLSRPDYGLTVEVVAVLGLALAVTIVSARRGLAWGALTAALCLIASWVGASWAFSARGVYLSPFLPTLGIAASLGAVSLAGLARQHVRAHHAISDLSRSRSLLVHSLLSLTEARDADTGRHSRRTQTYTRMLAAQLSLHPRFREYLTGERIELLASLAPLHDIGKVAVPDQVLNKRDTLTVEEYAEIKKHPAHGRDVIVRAERQAGAHDDPALIMAKEIVYTHHERWDGTGYPQGLHADQIPIPGRVVALVDFFDAVVTKRVYRDPISFGDAIALIVERRGTHFDPAVVDAFLHIAPTLQYVPGAERAE